MLATPGDGLLLHDDDVDDITLLRRHVVRLSRHVASLEDEEARRKQREIVLYPLVIGYLFLQLAKWFMRTN